ncbi:ParA family protein [Salinispirillum sp. LH 10-3-1]|uniref:ParA family protein n=1 Tax=Salinispirillum sp. LH 10-3-1 TaxID=2952525 RepID=A0AB38YE76_9GAMM
MKVVASYSIKGGVGKTTTAVNLAWLAHRAGISTLLLDLDPQGASSFYLRHDNKGSLQSKQWLTGKTDLQRHVLSTDYEWLDLVAAHDSFRDLDIELAALDSNLLRQLIRSLKKKYQLIVVDCPPTVNHLSAQIFRAAHRILVPVQPTTLSERTFAQLNARLTELGVKDSKLLPFFSMVEARKRLHREVMHAFSAQYPATLQAQIPFSAEIERMGLERAPLGTFGGKRAPARAYEALWRLVLTEARIPVI